MPSAAEDPVTGSLNAGLGLAPNSYTASQGTALGRTAHIYVEREGENIWIGGKTLTCIQGTLSINAGSGSNVKRLHDLIQWTSKLRRSSVLQYCAFWLHRKSQTLWVLLIDRSRLRKDLGLPEDDQNSPDIHTGRR